MESGLFVFAAIDPSDIEIPEWVPGWMVPLGIAMGVLFVAWLVFAILGYMHRRAYNLTKMETARAGKVPDPAFLKVDHEARKEALKRGDEYVRPADREDVGKGGRPPKPGWSFWGFLCRVSVILVAVAHFGVVAVSMADATHNAGKVMQDLSASDRFQAVVSKYWLGLALGGIVVLAEIVRYIRNRRAEA